MNKFKKLVFNFPEAYLYFLNSLKQIFLEMAVALQKV